MPTPILATKLYVPPLRPNLVLRPRLLKRLNEGPRQNQGFGRKLTLISAPAGFGKTTLVSAWLASCAQGLGCAQPTAWLSLDEGDSDPMRFLAYFVAALQAVSPKISEGILGLLHSPQPPPMESILTALLNEITAISDDFVLVLDDYHVLDAKAIDDALTFLLDHLPPQMHVVITTREDPSLPLARYRARGQLTELRAADLRFTPTEAAEFLNQAMGLSLAPEEIAAMETRTEGWVAGLQMAAISMQGRADSGHRDIGTFIQAFTGSHRFILDYLVEEVLQHQPELVRNFLLQTAILDRLSGPLCNAVTGQEDGNKMLASLERENLFVVSLDDQRQWYRYHHLFADVLQAHLMEEQPTQASTLHRRASAWCEQNGLRADAIRHALAIADFERAADLIEPAWRAMTRNYQTATLLGWMQELPDQLMRARPVLSVGYALALLERGELEAADARLRDAERGQDSITDLGADAEADSPPHSPANSLPNSLADNLAKTREQLLPSLSEMVVVDEEEFRSLPATIAVARATYAQALGDGPSTVKYAQRALDLLAEDEYEERAIPASLLGLTEWVSGDLEAAHCSFVDVMASFQMADNARDTINVAYVLADIRMAQGRLREASRTYDQALQLATSRIDGAGAQIAGPRGLVLQGMVDLYVGLSELHCEQGDLEAAAECLRTGKELGEQAVIPGIEYRWWVAQARIKEVHGELEDALDLLNKAERLYTATLLPDARPLAAQKARIWIAQGRLTEALGWVREQGLSMDDELSYLQEFQHITLARVHIAQYQSEQEQGEQGQVHSLHDVQGLLARLLKAAEAGERRGSVIEIYLLQAIALELQGATEQALSVLIKALKLGKPEGYVRPFVDAGEAIGPLLRRAASQGIETKYATALHRIIYETNHQINHGGTSALDAAQPLLEPLSHRELELLMLVADGLSNQQISDELVVSLSTTKKHMSNILGKLSASNRVEAVRRARDLQLL